MLYNPLVRICKYLKIEYSPTPVVISFPVKRLHQRPKDNIDWQSVCTTQYRSLSHSLVLTPHFLSAAGTHFNCLCLINIAEHTLRIEIEIKFWLTLWLC